MPQLYFVPVSPTCSRITHSSGVVGSTSTLCDFPLMVSATMKLPPHSPVGEIDRQLARDDFCWRDFRRRASGESLAASTKVGHSQFRERERCRSRIDDQFGLQFHVDRGSRASSSLCGGERLHPPARCYWRWWDCRGLLLVRWRTFAALGASRRARGTSSRCC